MRIRIRSALEQHFLCLLAGIGEEKQAEFRRGQAVCKGKGRTDSEGKARRKIARQGTCIVVFHSHGLRLTVSTCAGASSTEITGKWEKKTMSIVSLSFTASHIRFAALDLIFWPLQERIKAMKDVKEKSLQKQEAQMQMKVAAAPHWHLVPPSRSDSVCPCATAGGCVDCFPEHKQNQLHGPAHHCGLVRVVCFLARFVFCAGVGSFAHVLCMLRLSCVMRHIMLLAVAAGARSTTFRSTILASSPSRCSPSSLGQCRRRQRTSFDGRP